MLSRSSLFLAVLSVATATTASAHLNYNGKNFGVFDGLGFQSTTISQNVPNLSGWADGTDADFGNTHGVTFYRFSLSGTVTVTVTVDAANPGTVLPGFSIYAGLGQTAPSPDYETEITNEYLATLPGPQPKEGAFRALTTWMMGSETDLTFAEMSTFTYMGNAADGTSANFGLEVGINGDGLADGHISRSFLLPAGDYTLVVGGANYSDTAGGPTLVLATVSAVPEPGSGLLTMIGCAAVFGLKRRERSRK